MIQSYFWFAVMCLEIWYYIVLKSFSWWEMLIPERVLQIFQLQRTTLCKFLNKRYIILFSKLFYCKPFRRLGLLGHVPDLWSLKFFSWGKIYTSPSISETRWVKEKEPIQWNARLTFWKGSQIRYLQCLLMVVQALVWCFCELLKNLLVIFLIVWQGG